MKSKVNSLIRDKEIYSLLNDNTKFKAHILENNTEFQKCLCECIKKSADNVGSSVSEYIEAKGGINTYCIEKSIAELMEYVVSLTNAFKISPSSIKKEIDSLREKSGMYNNRVFLEWKDEC